MAETPLDKNNKRPNCLKYNLQHCNRQKYKSQQKSFDKLRHNQENKNRKLYINCGIKEQKLG